MERTTGYRVSEVENLTGVGTHTLRAWERRYGVPRPPRSEGRQRRYTAEDVDMVRRMKQLADTGLALGEAAALAQREARERRAASRVGTAYELILERLQEFDERGAIALWAAATEGREVDESIERVAIPLLVKTGLLWEAGLLGIATEHFVSAFLRARLDLLYRSAMVTAGSPTVLLACLPGERHELGMLMLAVMLRAQGVPTTFLGADVPIQSIVESATRLQPSIVVLNAHTSEFAPLLSDAIKALRAACKATVVYGGRPFDENDDREMDGAMYGGPSLPAAARLIGGLYRRSLRTRNN